MSTTHITIDRLARRLAVGLAAAALVGPIASAQASDPPPPPPPPGFSDTTPLVAPTEDVQPTAPAPQQQQQQQAPASTDSTQSAPAPSGESTDAPQGGALPAPTTGTATVTHKKRPQVRRRCRRTRHHRTCARPHRKHHKRTGVAKTSSYDPSVPLHQDYGAQCTRSGDTDYIDEWAPGMTLDGRTDAGYFAYQPIYYWFNFATGQWTYGGSGMWMWQYHQNGAFGGENWYPYGSSQGTIDGAQATSVTRGYYWRVAIHYYWYASGAAPAHNPPLEWISSMLTAMPSDDIFAAGTYTNTTGLYCYAA